MTVNDDETPTITQPADITVGTDPGQPTAVVNFAVPAFTDNVGATIVQSAGLSSGAAFPLGMTTIEFTATDDANNSSTVLHHHCER